MGKRAVAQAELSGAKPRKLKKDTVGRRDFYEAARTLWADIVVGVSQDTVDPAPFYSAGPDATKIPCCRIDIDGGIAHLSDPQVRELIQVLKDYLSAKED